MRNQVESARTVTAAPPTLKRRARLHYPGDNSGNVIGPVVLPPWIHLWATTYQDKKAIFGPNIVAVGGKGSKHERVLVEGDVGEEESQQKRTGATVEPCFFHSLPEPFWAEVINSCSAAAVIDLTASDERLPLACLRAHVPYVGLCLTEAHASALWRRINICALSAATDEGDALYDSDLAAGLKRKAGPNPPTPKKKKSKRAGKVKTGDPKRRKGDGKPKSGSDSEPDPFSDDPSSDQGGEA